MMMALSLGLVVAALVALRCHSAPRARVAAVGCAAVATLLALLMWLKPVHHLVVLTPGSDPQAINRAQRARRAVAVGAAVRGLESAPDMAAVTARYGALTSITLLGPGLAAHQWNESVDLAVRHVAPARAARIAHLQAPQRAAPGTAFVVHGVVNDAPATPTVALLGPGDDVIDIAAPAADGRFTLRARTRAAGQFKFRVELRDASDRTVDERDVPLDVRAPTALRLLTLWGAPSFEARFVHDWARRGGASLLTRTQLGESIYRTDATRARWPDDTRLDDALLANVDIVVADGRALSALAEQERASLARAGSALILVPPLPADSETFGLPAPLARDGEYAAALAGASATLITATGYWPGTDEASVITTVQGQTLARRVTTREGPAIATTVSGSHRFVLAGAASVHADYWQALFDAALDRAGTARWSTPPGAPVADRPWQACRTDATGMTLRSARGTTDLTVFNTPGRSGCALTVPDAGWFELSAVDADGTTSTAQWFAGKAGQTLPASVRAPLSGVPVQAGDSPRQPRLPLALLALALASALWQLERRAWPRAGPASARSG